MTDLIAAYREAQKYATRAAYLAKRPDFGLHRGDEVVVCGGRKLPHGSNVILLSWGEGAYGGWVRVQPAEGEAVFLSRHHVRFPTREQSLSIGIGMQARARDAAQAIVNAAGIDLTKPVETSTARMNAYSDDSEAVYACNPDVDIDVIKVALEILDPPQSSWGALRWSLGSSVVSRDGDRVTVRSSTGICD